MRDVTLLFILAKIARDIHLAQPDNIDDIIGYIVAFDRATNPTDYHESLDPIFPELECGPTKTQVPVTEYDCKPKQEFQPISKEMPLRWWNKLNIDEVDSVVDEFNGRR